jgi:hypothetical protein
MMVSLESVEESKLPIYLLKAIFLCVLEVRKASRLCIPLYRVLSSWGVLNV